MTIRHVHAYLRHLPLRKPYTIAHYTFSEVELVFLEITLANGIVGFGSASPAEEVVGETPAQTLAHCQSAFFEQLIGRDIADFQQIIHEAQAFFPHAPGTVALLDIALHEAFLRHTSRTFADLYGCYHEALPTSVTIGIMGVEETLEEARNFWDQGFRVVKVKTGMNVQEDIERVLRLHDRFGERLAIRVDANQGYAPAQLRLFVDATQKVPLEVIEQPFPVGEEVALLDFPWETRRLLVADESLHGPAEARQLARKTMPYGVFNIKLMKCGGILGALELARIAQPAGIELFWGCNDESAVSITAALRTAFACPHTRYLDLDGSFDLAEDVGEAGFVVEQGMMRLR